jgi:hypothetical protein
MKGKDKHGHWNDDDYDCERGEYKYYNELMRKKKQIKFFNGLYRLFTREGLRSFSTFEAALNNENAWEDSCSYTSEGDLQPLFGHC